ncbi:MAG: hypothetical protein OHK0022_24280 [Roseiflexaceae bacterium]
MGAAGTTGRKSFSLAGVAVWEPVAGTTGRKVFCGVGLAAPAGTADRKVLCGVGVGVGADGGVVAQPANNTRPMHQQQVMSFAF